MTEQIRVLIVDDSAFMRSALKNMVNADPELTAVGTARDGAEAIDKIIALKPDIITLDLEMPRLNGIETLKILMKEMPVPVLVVSSLSEESAQETFEALHIGAIDFICKDLQERSLNIMNIEETLIGKIKYIVRSKAKPYVYKHSKELEQRLQNHKLIKQYERANKMSIVAIGASTGGPKSLHEVIPFLPKDLPVSVLIVQHMPAFFTKSFAERLNTLSDIQVKEAEAGELIEPGIVYIAQGGLHMKADRRSPIETRIMTASLPDNILYRPSVDVMMHSAVEAYGNRCLGVIMTGMGSDGCAGMRAIKQCGGKTISQDEDSCIVYGMPKSVNDAGLADKIVPLSKIAGEILNMI